MMGALGMLTQSLGQTPGMEGVSKSVSASATGNSMIGGLAVCALGGAVEAAVLPAGPAEGARQLRVPPAVAQRLLR